MSDTPTKIVPRQHAPKVGDPAARNLRQITEDAAHAEPPAELPADLEPAYLRGPARRPVPQLADPLMQWASGLTTHNRQVYAGWLVESSKDDALDKAMAAAGVDAVVIKHGSGNLVTHWALSTASLLILCDGIQSIAEMRDTQDRYGIAFGWEGVKDSMTAGRLVSRLRCRVLIAELVAVGYVSPLLLTLRGTMTGDLLSACMQHFAVLDQLNAYRAQASKPELQLPFYAVSLPIGPGQEVQRGNGGQSKTITPPAAQIPDPITAEYIKSRWTKQPTIAAIEALLDATVAWSVTESAKIASGATAEGWEE